MKNNKKYDTVPMVKKTCEILNSISNNGGIAGISTIANETGFSKSTIFRIVRTLEEQGFIIQNESTGKYQLGMFFLKGGLQVQNSIDLRNTSYPIIEKLAKEIGETINLSIPYEDKMLVVESVSGEASRLVSKLEPVSPLYCSGTGKLFMVDFTDEELTKYFNSDEIIERTYKTITNAKTMKKIIADIKKNGYSFDDEENEYGLFCIAAPVKDNNDKTVAGISVSGPTTRIKHKGKEMITEKLINAAKLIEKRMGFRF